MKVYEFAAPDGGEEYVIRSETSPDNPFRAVAGVPQGAAWRPVPVELVRQEDGVQLRAVDTPFLNPGALIVIKNAALPGVASALAPYAELLPLDCGDEPLTAVNVTTVVDALDEQVSDITRFKDGRIMMIDRYIFSPGAVPEHGLFKVPQDMRGATFCTEPMARFLSRRLDGLNLREV